MNRYMKVLVVDDFSTMRRLTKHLLRDLGVMHIQETDNGNDALTMVESGDFDLVVANFYLPGMDGIDLLKAIKNDPSVEHVAVLMVVEEQEKEQIVTAAKAGADGYIVKPFNAMTLQGKLDKIFDRKR